jgi:peptide/nickel transport system permease protein
MTRYILNRLMQALLTVAVMATITFFGVFALGNPVEILISPQADQAERIATIARLGLDQPLYAQFFTFIKNLLQGDLGKSFVHGTSAVQLIIGKIPATLQLAGFALMLTLCIGLPLGMIAGLNANNRIGKAIKTFSIIGFSLPNFWFGIILILVFAVWLKWLPAGGRGTWAHMILPAFTLAIYKMSLIIRLATVSTEEAMREDYVRFARAKGLSEPQIVVRHVLKNIMIPIVTVLGLELGSMIAFAVVTEKVFAYPGMGKLLIDSIFHLDRPVIVAYLMVIVVMFVTINLIVDLLYTLLDPRIRIKG